MIDVTQKQLFMLVYKNKKINIQSKLSASDIELKKKQDLAIIDVLDSSIMIELKLSISVSDRNLTYLRSTVISLLQNFLDESVEKYQNTLSIADHLEGYNEKITEDHFQINCIKKAISFLITIH